jgi:hypothetical protein
MKEYNKESSGKKNLQPKEHEYDTWLLHQNEM